MNENSNPMTEARPWFKRRLAVGALIAIVATGLGYGAYLIMSALIFSYRMKTGIRRILAEAPQIRAEWNREFGPFEDFPKRFPKQSKNETALQSVVLFKKLGFDQANNPKTMLEDYIQKTLMDSSRSIATPPKELEDYFKGKQQEIIAYRQWLILQSEPRWEVDLSKGASAPIPDLLMQMQSHKLFAAGALLELRAGHEDEALNFLEAGWKLNQGLKDHPELICHLIYIASARYQLGVLRKITSVPSHWPERLRDFDRRDAMHTTMGQQIYTMSVSMSDPWFIEETDSGAGPGKKRLVTKSEKRFTDATLLDVQRVMTNQTVRWVGFDTCRQVSDKGVKRAEYQPASWNVIGEIIFPNLDGAWRRVGRLNIETEVTSKLLQVRAARDASAEHLWPATIPGIETTICKDQRWIYEVSPDRKSMTLRYSAKLDWPGLKGPKLPMSFSETTP